MQIAVIDPELTLREQLCKALQGTGHTCFASGELRALAETVEADLLVLRWRGTSGDRLPHAGTRPVLCVVDGEDALLAARAAGASDCLLLPLRRAELVARVQALLREAHPAALAEQAAAAQSRFGDFVFDARGARLRHKDKTIELTQKEFDLALLLFRNLGRPLSRATIQDVVWAREVEVTSRTMDTHVSRVRNKLGLRPERGFRLAPVYGFGYRLERSEG